MILFCHYISSVLIVSIIYQIRNFLIEYKNHFYSKENEIKGIKGLDFFVGVTFLIVIGCGLLFVGRQIWYMASAGAIVVIVKKSVWIIILLALGVGRYLYKNRKRSILQNMQIVSCIMLLVYIIFSYNQIVERCNDTVFAGDFYQEGSAWNKEYSQVDRFQNEGILGSVKRLVFVGRKQEIKQEFQFEYTEYNMKSSWAKKQIEKQYIDIEKEAEKVIKENGVTVYQIEGARKKDYKPGMTYDVSNKEKYDWIFIIESEDRILEFYCRDMEEISQEKIANILLNKFLAPGENLSGETQGE